MHERLVDQCIVVWHGVASVKYIRAIAFTEDAEMYPVTGAPTPSDTSTPKRRYSQISIVRTCVLS